MTKKPNCQIAIITNYYPPEMGAAANRISHLAQGLSPDFDVTVIAPLPNYPTGKIFEEFRNKYQANSVENGINIHRLWIFASASKNKILRLWAMVSFGFSLALYFLRHPIPNRVIIQSPPLIVAFISILLLRSKKRSLILNVSDLWPSAGLEMGVLQKGFFYKLLKKIELFNYKNSSKILGQSEEILNHIKALIPSSDLHLYRNYPIINPREFNGNHRTTNRVRIVYAGLLGIAQGVLKLCHTIHFDTVEFHIYGAGPEATEIRQFIKEHPELRIFFHGNLDRQSLHQELVNYDLMLIPLVNRIYGSVPSKIFEYAKLGLPLLYFGGGEGESIILKHQLGWVVEHGDYEQLNSVIHSIALDSLDIESKKEIQKRAQKEFDFHTQINKIKNIL